MQGHHWGTLALIGTLLAAPILASPTAAEAQTRREQRRARRLFARGVRYSDRGRWDQAADRFRQALALVDAPAIRYNLASALVEQGHFQEASDLLDQVAANEETQDGIREAAAETRNQLTSRAARLTIQLEGATGDEIVLLDDDVVLPESLGHVRWLAPGTHSVEVQRDGATIAEGEYDISAGALTEAQMELEAPPPPRVVAVEQAQDDESPTDRARRGGREVPIIPTDEAEGDGDEGGGSTWVWIAAGGAAVVAAGVVALLLSSGGTPEDPIAGNFMPGVITWP